MLLKIDDFRENESTPVSQQYDPSSLDLEFVDLHYLKKISLAAEVTRTDLLLSVKGKLTSQVEQTCNRCLERVASNLNESVDFAYEIAGKDSIDVTDDLRDLLLLDHPDKFLCKTDCQGICAQCGNNRNHNPCNCKAPLSEQRFSTVRQKH